MRICLSCALGQQVCKASHHFIRNLTNHTSIGDVIAGKRAWTFRLAVLNAVLSVPNCVPLGYAIVTFLTLPFIKWGLISLLFQ